MKDILIKKLDSNCRENDIYGFTTKHVDINPPQIITLTPTIKENKYIFSISDIRINAYDSILVGITIPQIKGNGKICYTKYPGLKLIKSFEEKFNNITINKMSGLQIMNSYFSPNTFKDDYTVGNRQDLCNIKEGVHYDDIIFQQIDLNIPIFRQFDKFPPHSSIKVPHKCKIDFELELNKITDILIYNRTFLKNSYQYIESLLPDVKLTLRGYNIQSKNRIEDKYIEDNHFIHINDSDYSDNPKEEYGISYKNISEIGWYCKSKQFSKKYFISYPGYNNSETDYIDAFRKRIFPDLIHISENEKFKRRYPSQSNFVCLQNNTEYEFDNLNKCKILIRNIPENSKIWFHTNILEFNRKKKEKDSYNISKKFKYIFGDYIKEENRIIPIEIIDELTIEDVSIPLDIWNHECNTAGRDLRSEKSKEDDIFINEEYIFGLDFVSKNIGFDKNVIIKAGPSERIYESNKFNFYFPYFGFNNYKDHYFLESFKYPCIGNVNFNIVNPLAFKPSLIESDVERNMMNCFIQVNWIKYNDNHPFKLIPKTLCLFIKTIKKISYSNDNNDILITS